jgi:putative transposase
VKAFLHSFFALLASATDKALAEYLEYLKAENRILRSKLPARVPVTPAERERLVKLGKPLGKAIKDLITIVSPRTFLRWANGETPARADQQPAKRGRPATPVDVKELILKLARESGWGYTRILGELKKLGVRKVARSTVVKILKDNGLEPGPQRGEGSWADFLKRHATTLWACDFFTVKVWTKAGLVDFFVLFFLQVGSRRVYLANVTPHPDRDWVTQQARNFAMTLDEITDKPRFLIRDRDTKFVASFDTVMKAEEIEVIKTAIRAPNQNAYAERFVQTVRQECLDHFLICGEKHLRHLLTEFLAHYHRERAHQGLDNRPPVATPPPESPGPVSVEKIVCTERLGGLLKHYQRAA